MKNTINKPKRETKSVSFQSTSRAQHAYLEAIQIINFYELNGKALVKITGNIVTVPAWFPLSPSAN